jgi:hypothetical protein
MDAGGKKVKAGDRGRPAGLGWPARLSGHQWHLVLMPTFLPTTRGITGHVRAASLWREGWSRESDFRRPGQHRPQANSDTLLFRRVVLGSNGNIRVTKETRSRKQAVLFTDKRTRFFAQCVERRPWAGPLPSWA